MHINLNIMFKKMKMIDLVDSFTRQIEEAVKIAENTNFKVNQNIQNLLICGLGGSGIGGSIAKQIADLQSGIPIEVSKGYFIPAYVNENSLVIISSYSGNTEETLNTLKLALQKKAQIICITSGGEIAKIAAQYNLDIVQLPSGFPPRACLAYSLTQILHIFYNYKLLIDNPLNELKNVINLLSSQSELIKMHAKSLADRLVDKLPVIYTTTYNEAIAVRMRQQLNENAKMLCWHHVIPEMNHNELVGWREKNEKLAVVFLLDDADYERNKKRIEIVRSICSQYTSNLINIHAKGKTRIEKTFYLIHLTDYLSCYLAEKRGFDATEIDVINYLKEELSRF